MSKLTQAEFKQKVADLESQIKIADRWASHYSRNDDGKRMYRTGYNNSSKRASDLRAELEAMTSNEQARKDALLASQNAPPSKSITDTTRDILRAQPNYGGHLGGRYGVPRNPDAPPSNYRPNPITPRPDANPDFSDPLQRVVNPTNTFLPQQLERGGLPDPVTDIRDLVGNPAYRFMLEQGYGETPISQALRSGNNTQGGQNG
jgi:hypothetical protein